MTRPGQRWRWAAWLGVVAVLALALAAGGGAFGGHPPAKLSLYQRTLQVAGQYRCPVCQGESAAASDAPAAVADRPNPRRVDAPDIRVVERHQEVVAGAVVLVKGQGRTTHGRAQSPRTDDTRSRGFWSAGYQRIRGSRRHQARWRLANARVAPIAAATASSRSTASFRPRCPCTYDNSSR